jgi:hypothetical protein
MRQINVDSDTLGNTIGRQRDERKPPATCAASSDAIAYLRGET